MQISLKFVPDGLIDGMSALVQLMTRHQIGEKPLPQPMMTKFRDVISWN